MAIVKRHRRHEAGFTAAEALVSAFLIGVGLVAIAGLFPVAHQSISSASQRTTAALLAEQGLEVARNTLLTDWSALPVGTTTSAVNGYTRTTQVTLVGGNASLKQVTVTTTSPNQPSVRLTTVIGN